MSSLDALENRSIHILREAYANFRHMAMLWSIGKDSTVLLWLARRAFFGHVPFPLVHVDTSFKIPEMIAYRDELARRWGLTMIVGRHAAALEAGKTFPDGAVDRTTCCKLLKADALRDTLAGRGPRYRLDLETGVYAVDPDPTPFTGVIVGVRADEEGSRSKERYFSARDAENQWDLPGQAPEFWNQFKTEFEPGTHVRIHPLLDWTEVDIWRYIEREGIPTIPLYFDQGEGTRYRSLGCAPCTLPVASHAKDVAAVIEELTTGELAGVPERAGRAQDDEDGGLEALRREGYM